MDTRYILRARSNARGAARPIAVAIVAVVVAFAAAAWFLIIRPYQQQMRLSASGQPTVQTPAAANNTAAPANVQEMDVNQLLSEASKAVKDQRLLAPAGNNAFEFYLRALAKQPGNPVATSALRETFPYAATDAEQQINAHNFNEAQREVDLLAKADPANYTLTILRSKMDAQRKMLDQQQVLDQQKAQLAAQKAAAEKQQAEQQKAQLAAEQKAQQARQAQEKQQAVATAAAATPTGASEAAGQGATSDAVLIKAVSPNYPTSALRSGQSGKVVVGFTINAEGRTTDIHVIDAQPRHVFDRAAMEAIGRYRFKPAMRDGVAVSKATQQTIEFNTGR